MRALVIAAVVGTIACGDRPFTPVGGNFSAGVESVDFGTVLGGTEVVREVPFTNTGRAEVDLDLESVSPFFAPLRVSLPGGATVAVEVRFMAGDGVSSSTLRARAGERTVEVALVGEGVQVLACFSGDMCRVSEFVLDVRACVEHVAQDGTACTPDNQCLEHGTCREGVCLGTARSCDDDNVCTTDGCATDRGCVHVPIRCPAPEPGNPCVVALCDPDEGCKTELLPDGALCGLTCQAVSRCEAGTCVPGDAPADGTVCGPPTVCRDEWTCQDRECTPPEPFPLNPAYRVELAGEPVSALRGYDGNVYVTVCAEDGGCALVSRTSASTSGFLRYAAPLSGPAELVSVSGGGVLLLEMETLSMHALAPPGAEQWRFGAGELGLPTDAGGDVAVTAPDRVVTGPGGEVTATWSWVDDGGTLLGTQALLQLAPDGGVLSMSHVVEMGAESSLAQDVDGTLVLFSPEGPVAIARPADGGVLAPARVASAPGARSLVVGGEWTVLGGKSVLAVDGGVTPLVFVDAEQPPVDAGTLPLLIDDEALHVFGEGCARGDGTTCLPAMRVYAFRPGETEAFRSTVVIPDDEQGRLVEAAALVAPGYGQGLGALTEQPGDGGTTLGVLRLLAEGREIEQCHLPDAPDVQRLEQVSRGLFDGNALYVVVRREGRWWLEAYELTGIEASGAEWPQASGVSGSRRAR
ncbi:MAG: hypothetical protein L0Y66_09620 [Myxococcaceae bacterium]|nr:hypothetical protein [Myxococcaceae bacterium]